MNAILNRAFLKASKLPPEEQAAVGATLLSLIEEPFIVDSHSREAIFEGLEQVKSGEVLSLEEVKSLRAVYSK